MFLSNIPLWSKTCQKYKSEVEDGISVIGHSLVLISSLKWLVWAEKVKSKRPLSRPRWRTLIAWYNKGFSLAYSEFVTAPALLFFYLTIASILQQALAPGHAAKRDLLPFRPLLSPRWHSTDLSQRWLRGDRAAARGLVDQGAVITLSQLAVFAFAFFIYNFSLENSCRCFESQKATWQRCPIKYSRHKCGFGGIYV